MNSILREIWTLLSRACGEAKKRCPALEFNNNAYEIFSVRFDYWRKTILEEFMKKDVKELDRHKISAIMAISIIESKAVVYNGELKDKIFVGPQMLALNCALLFMQQQLNDILKSKQLKAIEKYIFPEPFSCDTNYFDMIARNLYYEEHGEDSEGNRLWRLNPLQLANTFFFIELYTLEHLSIPTDCIKNINKVAL